jgi:hypothetical protein
VKIAGHHLLLPLILLSRFPRNRPGPRQTVQRNRHQLCDFETAAARIADYLLGCPAANVRERLQRHPDFANVSTLAVPITS